MFKRIKYLKTRTYIKNYFVRSVDLTTYLSSGVCSNFNRKTFNPTPSPELNLKTTYK